MATATSTATAGVGASASMRRPTSPPTATSRNNSSIRRLVCKCAASRFAIKRASHGREITPASPSEVGVFPVRAELGILLLRVGICYARRQLVVGGACRRRRKRSKRGIHSISVFDPFVMAGLVPAIHVLNNEEDVDARHKAGRTKTKAISCSKASDAPKSKPAAHAS